MKKEDIEERGTQMFFFFNDTATTEIYTMSQKNDREKNSD